MFEKIPDELKRIPNWVCWGENKIPKNPNTGDNAKSNDPNTWGGFQAAVEAVGRYGFNGIGFMIQKPYFGVDLDSCLDNQDMVDEFVSTLGSYTEISQSGTGLHIICKGKLPDGARRKGNVEMYEDRRYFIMTGHAYDDEHLQIVDCTESVKMLHTKYLASQTPKAIQRPVERVDFSDNEVIENARNCKSGPNFNALYDGRWEGLYSSRSEADMALCNHLAFWTQRNEAQIDRIYRSSGLMRDKWDSKRGELTYGQITVQKACADCIEVYEPTSRIPIKNLFVGFKPGEGTGSTVKYDLTDTGNAQRLKDMFGGDIRYCYAKKNGWMYWTGKVWVFDDGFQIKRLADCVIDSIKQEALRKDDQQERDKLLKFAHKTANSNNKAAFIKEAQHLDGMPIQIEELDCYTDYLNVQNGVVNLRNGDLIPHDQNFMMSKICACDYDLSDKKPERWLRFLNEVCNGDKYLVKYLQKCVGYSLTGSVREQCAFFLYGLGNNGKSTFLETISDMMGDYASNAQPETIMTRKFGDGGAGSDIARLRSARMVTTEEPTEGGRLNEGLVKQLTGGGKVTCRFLYGNEFEYEPEFKIWIATNHKPVIRGTDYGIWRRIRLIPFEVNIPPEKVDKHLKYKFREEMPQILHWAVQGCILYRKEGLEPPSCVKKSTEEYKAEMDLLATFMDACVAIDYTATDLIPANEIYAIYVEWAKENNEYIMTSRRFFGEFSKRTPERKRIASGMVYQKIRLTEFAKRFLPRKYQADMFR